MDETAKTPESPKTMAKELLAEVRQRGLSVYSWDGALHCLPARLAGANHDLIVKLHQYRAAVCKELETKP